MIKYFDLVKIVGGINPNTLSNSNGMNFFITASKFPSAPVTKAAIKLLATYPRRRASLHKYGIRYAFLIFMNPFYWPQ